MTCNTCLSGRHVGCRGCGCGVCSVRCPTGTPSSNSPKHRTPRKTRRLTLLPPPDIDPADQRLSGREWKWPLSPAQIRTSQIMRQTGATWDEVARVFNLSKGTVHHTLSRENPLRDFAVWYANTLPLPISA